MPKTFKLPAVQGKLAIDDNKAERLMVQQEDNDAVIHTGKNDILLPDPGESWGPPGLRFAPYPSGQNPNASIWGATFSVHSSTPLRRVASQ